MTKEQLRKEKILTQVTLSKIISPDYKKKLEEKLKMIDEESKIRTSAELANFKFIGVPTYDMRVFLSSLNTFPERFLQQNPKFKEMFAIDEFIVAHA